MTLREMLDDGIVIEGLCKIQSWETENQPTVYYEETDLNTVPEHCLDREVTYLYPYSYQYTSMRPFRSCVPAAFEAGICIELKKKEEGE